MKRPTLRLGELTARDRRAVERELAAGERAQRLLREADRIIQRAARGRAHRSAVRLARRLLRTMSEVRV